MSNNRWMVESMRFVRLVGLGLLLGGASPGCSASHTPDTLGGGAGPEQQGGCAAGQLLCDGVCTSVETDPANCGACGVVCATGQDCIQGSCQCQSDLTLCSGACVDTQSDARNCGGCGTQCAGGQVCSMGRCSDQCDPGLEQCGSSCVDLSVNVANCGQCGNACGAGQQCTDGVCGCTNAGEELCGTSCVNTQTDPAHCGSCDNQCTGGATCSAGVCVGGSGGSSSAAGGAATDGGQPSTGGTSSGGTAATGGQPSTGGSSSATGGSAGTGGQPSTGGTSSGGTAATGGETATGGASTGGTSGCSDSCPFSTGITWLCNKRFMYGVNYAWNVFAGDFGGISQWQQYGVSQNANAVSSQLADMADNGVSVVRWWMWPDFRGDGVRFSGISATGLGGTAVADLNRALELAEQHDLYLMLTLFSFDGFRDDYDPNLYEIAINSSARSALINNAVRPFAAAAAASPNSDRVIAWDVINEPEWAISGSNDYGDPPYEPHDNINTVTHAQMEGFVSEVIAGLRAESDALVTVGCAASMWRYAWSRVDIDFYQFHIYDWATGVEQRHAYSDSPADMGVTDKPVVMGEFPLTGLDAADYPTMLASWYGNGYSGALGWAVTDPSFEWNATKAAVRAFADQHPCETQY
jgi:hypothetical protein